MSASTPASLGTTVRASVASIEAQAATQRVVRNSMWLLAQPILLGLAGLALFSFAARELGKEELGRFSAATAFVLMSVSFSGLGLSTLATRDIARDRDHAGAYASRLAGLRLTMAALVTALTILVALVLGEGRRTGGLVFLAVLAIPLEAFVRTLQDLFVALERARIVALANAFGAVARIAGSFAALALGFGVWGFVGGWLLADSASILFTLAFLRRQAQLEAAPGLYRAVLRPVFDMRFSISAVRRAFVFYLSGLVATGYQRFDVLILGWAAGHAELGIYTAAVGLVRRMLIIPEAIGTATFAGVSAAARVDWNVAREMTSRSMTLGLLVGMPLAAGASSLAEPIIVVLFGPEYRDAVEPLAISAWAVPLWCTSYVALFALTAVDREWTVLGITTVITVLALAGLVTSGRQLDASLAAMVVVGAQAAGTVLHLVVLRRVLGPFLRIWDLARIGLATGTMFVCIRALRPLLPMSGRAALLPLGGGVVACALAYLAIATLLGVAPWRELFRTPPAPALRTSRGDIMPEGAPGAGGSTRP